MTYEHIHCISQPFKMKVQNAFDVWVRTVHSPVTIERLLAAHHGHLTQPAAGPQMLSFDQHFPPPLLPCPPALFALAAAVPDAVLVPTGPSSALDVLWG
jgi:hypothetical protein